MLRTEGTSDGSHGNRARSGRGVPLRSFLRNTPATVDRSLSRADSVCGGAPAGHALELVSLRGAVDGGAGDAEEVGQFSRAVLALPVQGHQVGLLAGVELRLLPAESPFGFRHPHALLGAQPDQVGF